MFLLVVIIQPTCDNILRRIICSLQLFDASIRDIVHWEKCYQPWSEHHGITHILCNHFHSYSYPNFLLHISAYRCSLPTYSLDTTWVVLFCCCCWLCMGFSLHVSDYLPKKKTKIINIWNDMQHLKWQLHYSTWFILIENIHLVTTKTTMDDHRRRQIESERERIMTSNGTNGHFLSETVLWFVCIAYVPVIILIFCTVILTCCTQTWEEDNIKWI